MKQFKKSPRLQLEKFSTIFTQLGLVLVLFIVFISLEYETEQTAIVEIEKGHDPIDVYDIDKYKPLVVVKEIPLEQVQRREERVITTIIDDPQVIDDNDTETTIVTDVKDSPIVNVTIKDDEPEEDLINDDDDPKGISFVSKIPVFKGCENLSEVEGRKCFDKKMSKLVKRHFNVDLANDLGLRSGKNKILTQFVIDKEGNVTDVQIRAPHNALKRETTRILKKIPVFKPGEMNGKAVKVRYTLPISFQVE